MPNNVYNRNQECEDLQRRPICLTDSYHYFIPNEIKLLDHIEYERDMSVDDNEE